MKYYIEREASGYVGNCLLWWRKGGNGYTCHLADAEVFDDASDEFNEVMCSAKYRAWPKDHIDKAATLQVDHQRLQLDRALLGNIAWKESLVDSHQRSTKEGESVECRKCMR